MEKPQTVKTFAQLIKKRLPGWIGRLSFISGLILALLMLVAALVPRLLFFQENVSRWLLYPYFQAGSEGLMLSEAAIIRAGGSIYVPLRPDLFISGPYPPLYYYLLAILWPLDQGTAAGFTVGRIISLVAALMAALFIVLLVMAESRATRFVKLRWLNLGPGLVAGLAVGTLFLGMPAVTVWAVRVRADMLMVALQMAGLVLIARKPRQWQAFLALLPLTLAFYTKHTGLAAPGAALIFVALQNRRNWRRTLVWLVALIGTIGLPFLLLDLLTANQFFLRLFPYHDLGRNNSNFERYIELFWQENAALMLMSLLLLVVTLCWPIKDSWLERLANVPLSGWFLLFSLPLLLGLGVVGTDHNHFLPTEAAGCAAAGVLLGRWLALPPRHKARWLALLVIGGLWVEAGVIPAQRYEIEFRPREADYQRQMGRIVLYAANQPDPILTSEAGLLVLTNRSTNRYYYNDLFTLTALAHQGRYDSSGLLEAIQKKEFGLILAEGDLFTGEGIREDVWSPELVAAIRQNYQPKFRDIWFSYEPKS